MIKKAIAAAAAVLISTSASATTLDDTFSSAWILGDSLSDPGNLFAASGGAAPPSPPYFDGRFSSGPVWAEYLTDQFLVSGNFAFGGATAVPDGDPVPDLDLQQAAFLANAVPNLGDRPLVSLFFGANDLLDFVGTADVLDKAVAAANAIGASAGFLSSFGVEDFLIFNLPDLGSVPRFNLLQSDLAAEATIVTQTFNDTLAAEIAALEAAGLNVIAFDTFELFQQAQMDPVAFGITDTVTPCVFPSPDIAAAFGQAPVCSTEDVDTRLFFDDVHPNGNVHAIFYDAVEAQILAELAPVPLPAGALLLIGGLAGLVTVRRQRPRAGI